MTHVLAPAKGDNWVALSADRLPVESALTWVTSPPCGAVACFVGTVRDHAEGHTGVSAIDYEAYTSKAITRFEAILAGARERWPEIGRMVVWHRTGLVALKEASVVVVVSTPHRAEAFEACRYVIDTVKSSAPIWKKETWEGGSDWSLEVRPIESPPGAGQT
jgi:molybdopterin synthase catalytic subunit